MRDGRMMFSKSETWYKPHAEMNTGKGGHLWELDIMQACRHVSAPIEPCAHLKGYKSADAACTAAVTVSRACPTCACPHRMQCNAARRPSAIRTASKHRVFITAALHPTTQHTALQQVQPMHSSVAVNRMSHRVKVHMCMHACLHGAMRTRMMRRSMSMDPRRVSMADTGTCHNRRASEMPQFQRPLPQSGGTCSSTCSSPLHKAAQQAGAAGAGNGKQTELWRCV